MCFCVYFVFGRIVYFLALFWWGCPVSNRFFWRFQEHQMRASSKNLSFWLGWTVLVLVLVIAPPKKDNTRTTHTHTMFAVQSSSICARSSSSCQLKTQKTTSSKRVQRCHHSAVRLFCFVLFCVCTRARRRVLLPSEREREKKANFLPSRSRCIRAFARHALLIPSRSSFRCTFIIYDIIIIIATGSSQRLRGL